MARPSPSCAHDDDRLRLPAASPSRSNSAEKKESTDPRLSQLCPPYVTPSSSSSLEYHRSDARIVENGFAAGSGMSNSAKVGLARYPSELWKGVRRGCQRRAREPRILVHPAHELLDAVELELGPDPIDEGDVDDLAVEIAGKIEQKGFEQHRALVEHRPPSEARDAVVVTPARAHPHRVDAMLEAAGGVEAQIGGGIAEVASTLVAVHHLGADEPGIAEELVGFRHPAGGERRADRAGPHRPSRVFEPRHHVDGEAELCALRREIIGRSRAIEAEMKIKADGDAGDGKAPDQNARNEVLRGKACERRAETQHDRAAEPGRGQKPQLRALVGQPEQRLLGAKERAGMRLEGQRRRFAPERFGARQRRRDHGAVAAMYAVEIADGDDGAVERVVGG